MKPSNATIPYADPSVPAPPPAAWLQSLVANAPLPLVLAAAVLVGNAVVTPQNTEIGMQIGVAVIMAVSLQLINGFSGQFSLGHAGFMAVGAYFAGYPAAELSRELTDPAAVLLFYIGLFLSAGIGGALLLGLFLLARASGRISPALPPVLMVLIFAWVLADISLAARYPEAPPAGLVVSRAVGLLGRLYTFVVEGRAPAAAAVSGALPAALREPVCFLVLLIGAGLCAAAAGLVVGLPTLRLRGDYLAIATLGFAEIIRIGIQNAEPMGGPRGLAVPTYTDVGWLYGGAVVTAVVVWRIAYSAKGRAIQAVREDEIAAAACGIDTTRHKVLAFVAGAFFAGVGGALYAHYAGFLTPNDFGLQRSIEFVVMVVLGGLGSITGAIAAAVVLTFLPEMLRDPPDLWPWGFVVLAGALAVSYAAVAMKWVRLRRWVVTAAVLVGAAVLWQLLRYVAAYFEVNLADWRMVIYALLLIVMMLVRPQGLLGGKELWPRRLWGRRRVTSPVRDRPEPEMAAL